MKDGQIEEPQAQLQSSSREFSKCIAARDRECINVDDVDAPMRFVEIGNRKACIQSHQYLPNSMLMLYIRVISSLDQILLGDTNRVIPPNHISKPG